MINLHNFARNIRKLAIEAIYHARSGHPGGSLSIADILAALYFREMQIDPKILSGLNGIDLCWQKGTPAPLSMLHWLLRVFFPLKRLPDFAKSIIFSKGILTCVSPE